VPPRRLDFVGHSDFVETGDEFLGHFVELGGLQPNHKVLDVGCGIGRMARPLAGYLSAEGSYDGFDVNREGIGWCRRRYARHPNFHFKIADLYNKRYNPAGPTRRPSTASRTRTRPSTSRSSLGAHAPARGRRRAVPDQLHRVLQPGRARADDLVPARGRRAPADRRGGERPGVPRPENHVAVVSEDVPEEAVAYDEGWVYDEIKETDLAIVEPSIPGSWCGREDARSFQDLVVLEKPA
jgi:SAM-dependent methyltransferase